MRHLKKGRKFHRKKGQRKAFLKILGSNLILSDSIITTDPRAKELRSFIEKKITRAKKSDLNSIRYLRRYFSGKVVEKLIKEIAPLSKKRKGGYTRIIKIGQRKSDGAKIVKIELVK
ncbi:MAG: 50S ribosomal protein L17 [Candidatus Bathyarchaeota archaeon]|nr:50S ribosomal protein L17 [Candidatus Bathyarchaeota archaeon]